MFVQNSQVGKNLDKAWTHYEQVEEDRLTKTDTTTVRPLIHSQIVKCPSIFVAFAVMNYAALYVAYVPVSHAHTHTHYAHT